MAGEKDIGGRAYATRIAQRLSGPAQAILGYQQLIVEEVRETGPPEALADLETVLAAASELTRLVDGLIDGTFAAQQGKIAEAELRHDLRTPLNAILGYSEMVVEDLGDEMSPRLLEDIAMVQAQGRALLDQIDAIIDHARPEVPAAAEADAADVNIAAHLARTIAVHPQHGASEKGRILIVDDLKTNRDLLARRLRRDGHSVQTASSAAKGLEILSAQGIDLALLDILMPDMNGIELLAHMKADDRLREIPVLMVSGLKEQDAVMRCIEAGAEDYLPKPVDPILLRARIHACLERRRWRERETRYLASIRAEKERADTLLRAILPAQVVQRLEEGEMMIADRFEEATIIFADIVDFTPLAARTAPVALLQRLGALFSRFDELAELHGIEKIKTIGDAYMAAAGIPEPRSDHAAAAIDFARALVAEMEKFELSDPPLRLRVGIHSGPVIAGLIGRKRFVYDIWGHTVNVASRLESHGSPGRIQISQSTFNALRGKTAVDPQGTIDLKGVGAVSTYLVTE